MVYNDFIFSPETAIYYGKWDKFYAEDLKSQ